MYFDKDTTPAEKQHNLFLITSDDALYQELSKVYSRDHFTLLEGGFSDETFHRVSTANTDIILIHPDQHQAEAEVFFKRISADEHLCHLPLVVISENTAVEDKINWLEMGAFDCIMLPYDWHELNLKLNSYLKMKQYQDDLQEKSQIDASTGLWNKRHAERRLDELYSSFQRYHRHFSLISFTLDNQELYSQSTLKYACRAVSQLLWNHCRTCDVVSYCGNASFSLLLPETKHKGSEILADRVRASIAALLSRDPNTQGFSERCTVSLASYSTSKMKTFDHITSKHILQAATNLIAKVAKEGGNQLGLITDADLMNAESSFTEETLTAAKIVQKQHKVIENLKHAHQSTIALFGRTELYELLTKILSQTQALFHTPHVCIYMHNVHDDALVCRHAGGLFHAINNSAIDTQKGFIGQVFNQPELIHQTTVNQIEHEAYLIEPDCLKAQIGVSFVCANQAIGAMIIAYDKDQDRSFNEQDFNTAKIFSDLASVAIDNIRLYAASEKELDDNNKLTQELKSEKYTAESANLAKSTFLSNMSHELRTPLNAIIGYGEFLMEDADEMQGTELKPDLGKIVSAGQHLLGLINSILNLSKIESGKSQLYLESVELKTIVTTVAETAKPLLSKQNNTFKIEWIHHPEVVYIDKTKIQQVLLNLLGNAAKFTESGTITLRVDSERDQHEGEWLIFSIIDTGIGMTPENCKTLFDAFAQADASTTKRYGGTGLGLTISKSFCEMMGGEISATSQVHEGATFTVRIPGVMKLPKVDILSSHMRKKGQQTNVLLVSKEPVWVEELKEEGINIIHVNCISSCIELFSDDYPGGIILNEPEKNWQNLLCQNVSSKFHYDIPIIIILGKGAKLESAEITCINAGPIEYLSSPINIKELQARIQVNLRMKHYMDMLEEQTQVDSLTNLWNHTHYNSRLEEEVVSTKRYGRTFSIVNISIDNFNDLTRKQGFPFAKLIISLVGELLLFTCRVCDVPCRISNNTFSVILTETNLNHSKPFVRRLIRSFEKMLKENDTLNKEVITLSIGVVSTSHLLHIEFLSSEVMNTQMDIALQHASEASGNSAYYDKGKS